MIKSAGLAVHRHGTIGVSTSRDKGRGEKENEKEKRWWRWLLLWTNFEAIRWLTWSMLYYCVGRKVGHTPVVGGFVRAGHRGSGAWCSASLRNGRIFPTDVLSRIAICLFTFYLFFLYFSRQPNEQLAHMLHLPGCLLRAATPGPTPTDRYLEKKA